VAMFEDEGLGHPVPGPRTPRQRSTDPAYAVGFHSSGDGSRNLRKGLLEGPFRVHFQGVLAAGQRPTGRCASAQAPVG